MELFATCVISMDLTSATSTITTDSNNIWQTMLLPLSLHLASCTHAPSKATKISHDFIQVLLLDPVNPLTLCSSHCEQSLPWFGYYILYSQLCAQVHQEWCVCGQEGDFERWVLPSKCIFSQIQTWFLSNWMVLLIFTRMATSVIISTQPQKLINRCDDNRHKVTLEVHFAVRLS